MLVQVVHLKENALVFNEEYAAWMYIVHVYSCMK